MIKTKPMPLVDTILRYSELIYSLPSENVYFKSSFVDFLFLISY